jgi:Protein of unknown function (DUF664)
MGHLVGQRMTAPLMAAVSMAVASAGLTADQLKIRAVPWSRLSLLGLVRHTVEVERR